MEPSDKRPLQVDREHVYVNIYTQNLRVAGIIYVPLKGRISDYLNKTLHSADTFIPVTNATCYDLDGNIIQHADYLALNKCQIHLIMPHEDEE